MGGVPLGNLAAIAAAAAVAVVVAAVATLALGDVGPRPLRPLPTTVTPPSFTLHEREGRLWQGHRPHATSSACLRALARRLSYLRGALGSLGPPRELL